MMNIKKLVAMIIFCASLWGSTFAQTNELNTSISWLYENGLTRYNVIEEFMPDNNLLREQASKFFANFAKTALDAKPDDKRSCNFSDLRFADETLRASIIESCELGIMNAGTLVAPLRHAQPKRPINNAEAITVVMRSYFGHQDETKNPRYTDYYTLANQYNLLQGLDLGKKYNANQAASRGEVAVFLHRSYNAVPYNTNSNQTQKQQVNSYSNQTTTKNTEKKKEELGNFLHTELAKKSNNTTTMPTNSAEKIQPLKNILNTSKNTNSDQQSETILPKDTYTCDEWLAFAYATEEAMQETIKYDQLANYSFQDNDILGLVDTLNKARLLLEQNRQYVASCINNIDMLFSLQQTTLKEHVQNKKSELCNSQSQDDFLQWIKDDRRTLVGSHGSEQYNSIQRYTKKRLRNRYDVTNAHINALIAQKNSIQESIYNRNIEMRRLLMEGGASGATQSDSFFRQFNQTGLSEQLTAISNVIDSCIQKNENLSKYANSLQD